MPTTIPSYALYGDQPQPSRLDAVHIEQIHERSSLFDYSIEPHVHEGLIQVLYPVTGGGDVFVDGTHWNFVAPALIVVPARHVHGFEFHRDIDGPVVTAAQRPLESLVAAGAPELLAHVRRPAVFDVAGSPRHGEVLMPLFDAIAREYRAQRRGEASAGTALLMALFVQIARIASESDASQLAFGEGRSRKAEQVERFRTMIDARFRERWSVERYADAIGLSAGQLSRLCRELLGESALDLINGRIVHEAERELLYSALSVKQIASVLGYADEAYFGRFFKKHTGMTPTEFRDRARLELVAPEPAAAPREARRA